MVAGINYSLPVPLYPNLAFQMGFDESYVGFIFCLYSLANIIFIPLSNKLITYFTRFNLLIIALLIMMTSTILFLILDFIEDKNYFTIFSIIARTLQGVSVEYVCILVFSLSIIISDSDDSQENLAYAEMFMSLGRIIGPLIAYLFGSNHYSYSFFFSFLLQTIALFLLFFKITLEKDKLNQMSNEEELSFIKYIKTNLRSLTNDDTRYKRKINKKNSFDQIDYSIKFKLHRLLIKNHELNSNEAGSHNTSIYSIKQDNTYEEEPKLDFIFFFKLMFNKLIILTVISSVVDYICQVFYTPVFTKQMNSEYNISIKYSSLFLSLFYVIYVIGLRTLIIISDIFPTKFLIAFGLLINSIALVFFSPSLLFPQDLKYVLFGFFLQNFFGGLICINAIVDFTDSFKFVGYNDFVASDLSSAMYFLSNNLSELIGPLLGGLLTHKFGFSITCNIIGTMNLLCSFIFFSFNYNKIYNDFVSEVDIQNK